MVPLDPRSSEERCADLRALSDADAIGVVHGTGERVEAANGEFLRLARLQPEDLHASPTWHHFAAADQVERVAAAMTDMMTRGSTTVLADLVTPSGERVPTLVCGALVPESGGRWVAAVVDLSQHEWRRRLAVHEAAIVSTLLEDAPMGFALIDQDMRFVRVNRELAAMNGASVAEHEGADVFSVVPGIRETAEAALRHVLDTGEALRAVEVVGFTDADPGVEHTWVESFFPVRAHVGGPVLGVATVARDETQVRRLQRDLALALEKQRTALREIQRSLLPESLPQLREVEFAARYVSASDEVRLGGDWYDVMRAPDGRVVLSVGDAVGHGLVAVGLMARASAAIRAYVSEGYGPSDVLARLNALLLAPDSPGMASAVVVALDRTTGRAEYASAGHPFPALREPDGRVSLLRAAQGPLLGTVDDAVYPRGEVTVQPDGTLVLYTDGLVERRRENLTDSLARLQQTIAACPPACSPGELVEATMDGCLEHDLEDDICVLVARRTSPAPAAADPGAGHAGARRVIGAGTESPPAGA